MTSVLNNELFSQLDKHTYANGCVELHFLDDEPSPFNLRRFEIELGGTQSKSQYSTIYYLFCTSVAILLLFAITS